MTCGIDDQQDKPFALIDEGMELEYNFRLKSLRKPGDECLIPNFDASGIEVSPNDFLAEILDTPQQKSSREFT